MDFKNMDAKKITFLSVIVLVIILSFTLSIFSNKIRRAENGADVAYNERVPNQQQVQEPTKKPSDYKIGIPYEDAMKSEKPAIVLFYADWCHYCVRFMPIFEKLHKDYKKTYEFVKINVEDPKYEKVVQEYSIAGFPTVFLVNPKSKNKTTLSNSDFGDYSKLKSDLDKFAKSNK